VFSGSFTSPEKSLTPKKPGDHFPGLQGVLDMRHGALPVGRVLVSRELSEAEDGPVVLGNVDDRAGLLVDHDLLARDHHVERGHRVVVRARVVEALGARVMLVT
jgi:hypothetical protein